MMKTQRTPGFTLLEVVVALAIVALALGGSMRIARSSARNTGHLEAKIQAHWVAQNVAAILRLSEAGTGTPKTFSEVVMGRTYVAEVAVTPDGDERLAAAITVSADDAALLTEATWLPRTEDRP